MITQENIKDLLLCLGFEKSENSANDVMTCHFANINADISVDFTNQQIIYPAGVEADRDTTKNFSKNENFVVLECVIGLFAQGYKPEHIVLEPSTPGGREDSFFYGDILIRDNNQRPYMLIECKTTEGKDDDEFNKAWRATLRNGSQLFNYYNTYRQAEYLALYTSDFVEGEPRCSYRLITMKDNHKYLETNPSLMSFSKVAQDNGTRDDFFNVWSETYSKDFSTNGAFEVSDTPAFGVGKKRLSIYNIDEVREEDINRKSKQFDQILRQYNVSSHENAFDKLVNLILVKVVDEVSNPNDLQFLWKGAAYDDFYSFQDRLQQLYKKGMQKYLGEEVTYIDNTTIESAFQLQKNDPDAIKDTILDYFRQLKFYSNSDFGFLDVHNKQLFFQNAIILKEVVEMLQDIKLKTDADNPFLGTLFEGFLDDGVKQSEGQFFTPTPITRFIVSSLPLENIIQNTSEIPYAIDYACGAGHFLNEYASQIKPFVMKYKGKEFLTDFYNHIFGIEKEYRLSKVSKVSSFMYGQDGIQIIYGDALLSHKDIDNGKFNILVANPPYSVKGFLATLPKDSRKLYELSGEIDENSVDTNDNIEVFFIERAKQLLASGGLAAIILPSTVITDQDNLHVKTREVILKYFDIIAICEFGGSTFGKTTASTVVLFMRKKKENPEISVHYKNRVNAWFNGNHSSDTRYADIHFLHDYIDYIGVEREDYKKLMDGILSDELKQNETFASYVERFSTDAEYRRIANKTIKASYTQAQKENDLAKHIISSIIAMEKEKLYYYMLCESNPSRVLVLKTPTKNTELKNFLGYEWKKSHNSLRVNYLNNNGEDADRLLGINQIKTPLFDPANLNNESKLNFLIRQNYLSQETEIPDELMEYVSSYRLTDLIDFKHETFDKRINTTDRLSYPKIQCKESIITEKLGNVAPYVTKSIKMQSVSVDDYISTDNMLQNCAGIVSYTGTPNISSVTEYLKGDILVSNIRPYLKKIWLADKNGGCSKDVLVFRNKTPKTLNNEYLKVILSTQEFFDYMMVGKTGIKMPRGDKKIIPSFEVPIPSMKIQAKIVEAMNSIDNEYNHNPLTLDKELEAKRAVLSKYLQ